VWAHGEQFHGAGVEAAVPGIRDALAKLAVSMNVLGPLRLEWEATPLIPVDTGQLRARFEESGVLPVLETAHGLTVVGWKGENGLAHCPEHRPRGGTMITASDLVGTVRCIVCDGRLGTVTGPVCLCTHPRSTHNANGLCIALPGVLGCGCLGWSEARP